MQYYVFTEVELGGKMNDREAETNGGDYETYQIYRDSFYHPSVYPGRDC
jgi:hypothetical protein